MASTGTSCGRTRSPSTPGAEVPLTSSQAPAMIGAIWARRERVSWLSAVGFVRRALSAQKAMNTSQQAAIATWIDAMPRCLHAGPAGDLDFALDAGESAVSRESPLK